MLIQYAVCEPGMNWFNQRYAVDRFIVNVPGWELPSSWNDAESLPEKGILTTRYYAGDGLCLKACRPRRKLRFALLTNVLVTLEDLRSEEAEFYRTQDPSKIATIIPSLRPQLPRWRKCCERIATQILHGIITPLETVMFSCLFLQLLRILLLVVVAINKK